MAQAKTKIEWTDSTWSPTTGCDRVSAGCDHCYAMTMAKRLKAMGSPAYQNDGDPRTSGPGFAPTMHIDRLDQPLRWTKPRRIFVDSMADLFHDDVPDDFIAQVFAVMRRATWHTFQLLTKRHGRMRSLLSSEAFGSHVHELAASAADPFKLNRFWPLPHVWLGVSVEIQQWADIRIPALLETPAAVHFLSCEPLLGPIDLNHNPGALDFPNRIGWVIVGGESGRDARPMHPQWARDIRDQCIDADVPFLFKQAGSVLAREWGCKDRKGGDASEWPESFPREYPRAS